jgi:hypothetical protein
MVGANVADTLAVKKGLDVGCAAAPAPITCRPHSHPFPMPVPGEAPTPHPRLTPPRWEGYLLMRNPATIGRMPQASTLNAVHGWGLKLLTEMSSALGGREQWHDEVSGGKSALCR